MLRVMIDSNIYDKIAEDNLQGKITALCRRGSIEVLTTHIQLDELSNVLDDHYRSQLRSVEASCVPTDVIAWDVSRWDECKWGNRAANSLFTELKGDKSKRIRDAIIGTTAENIADIIVTEDVSFSNGLRRVAPNVEVYRYSAFKALLDSLV